ncbi:MAG: DUF2868 domain-containing protein [Pseudohongiellaceae bacterium]
MNSPNPAQDSTPSLSLMLCLLGGFLGVILSYGVLSGDAQGQVNLLFLLLLFVFLPVLALLATVLFLLRPSGRGIVGWLLELPVWPASQRAALMTILTHRERKAWLIYQAQFFSLGFSLGCLLLYLLLLLATDISFVWRSTLLESGQLLPVLETLALPWWFWDNAQASLVLLEQTRDFRLDLEGDARGRVGLWWRYILAAQLAYSLLPRTVALLLARRVLGRRSSVATGSDKTGQRVRYPTQDPVLAAVTGTVAPPFVLLDWAAAPQPVLASLQELLGAAERLQSVGPGMPEGELAQSGSPAALVVLVKSWEPPLGELADFLQALPSAPQRLLLPLDFDARGLQPLRQAHLDEWRRFAAHVGDWQILQPGEEGT